MKMHLKSVIIFAMLWVVLVAGCHKHSISLTAEIWFCDFIQFQFETPDAGIERTNATPYQLNDTGKAMQKLLGTLSDGQEHLVFSGVTSKFIDYDSSLYMARDEIFVRSQLARQGRLYTQQDVMDLKEKKKNELWIQYRDLKETAKEASNRLRQIQANE